MRTLSLLFSFIFPIYMIAQVGIGTTTPDASAMLDITSTNQGVLVPRVALTDVTDNTAPVNAPATGLLVWNTNASVTGGNGVGFYFFNGAQWVQIQEDISDLAFVRAHLNATYNQPATGASWVNINFASVDFDTTGGSYDNGTYQFTAPTAGYYRINASYHTTAQANTNYYGIAIYIAGSVEAESTYNHHGTGDVVRQLDTIAFLAAGTVVEVRIRAESNAVDIDGFSGKTYMEIQQLSKN